MRKIGHIDTFDVATRFSDYLYAQGTDNEAEGDDTTGYDIWVHNEELLEAAKGEFDAFLLNPDEDRYLSAGKIADTRRREVAASKAQFNKTVFDRKRIMRRSLLSAAPVTFALIVASVLVTFFGGLGSNSAVMQWLSITPYTYDAVTGAVQCDEMLPEVVHGQVWRLVTPIFIHASVFLGSLGLLHILFNMMWLKDLGQMLESAQGKRNLIIKVLVLAVLSNLGQHFVSGPNFGGMSGVVFGLLGYAWTRGRYDLTSGLFVHNQTAVWMVAWFFLCLSGLMGAIANTAHGVGLVVGVAWGYADALFVNARRSK
jgi:GlpG protein